MFPRKHSSEVLVNHIVRPSGEEPPSVSVNVYHADVIGDCGFVSISAGPINGGISVDRHGHYCFHVNQVFQYTDTLIVAEKVLPKMQIRFSHGRDSISLVE